MTGKGQRLRHATSESLRARAHTPARAPRSPVRASSQHLVVFVLHLVCCARHLVQALGGLAGRHVDAKLAHELSALRRGE
jgi:hypothetical protein